MLHLHGKSCKSAVQFLPYLIAKLVTALCKQADGGLFADRKKTPDLGQFIFGNAWFLWVVYGLILMETFGFYCMLENTKTLEKKS